MINTPLIGVATALVVCAIVARVLHMVSKRQIKRKKGKSSNSS